MAKKKKTEPELIGHLPMWDWDTLVASLRYYENGMTIASAAFPHNVVSRFWGLGNIYSDNVRECIANQFVNIDHHGEGERYWHGRGMNCDKRAWTAFYRFCEAWLKGFTKIGVKRVDGKIEERDGFHTDFEDMWYDKETYISHGTSCWIPRENIFIGA